MIVPSAHTLGHAMAFLDPALAGRAARRRLAVMARRLPDIAHAVGFECRLAGTRDRVDLGITVERSDLAAIARGAEHAAAGLTPDTPAWAGVSTFLARWTSSRGSFAGLVPRIFLEFDAAGRLQATAAPSVFASLEWRAPLSPAWRFGIIERLASTWRGRPSGKRLRAQLRRCITALPARGGIVVAGAMLARPGAPLRLSVLLPRRALAGYLRGIGCSPDDGAFLLRLLATWDRRDVVDLDLALDDGGLSAVAIQLHGERRGGGALGWASLLGALVDRGWCEPDKRRALLRWPGTETCPLVRGGWPVRCERYLSSVKLARNRDGGVEAKAYLAVAPQLQLLRPR